MKIAVMGSGGVGAYYGGLLAGSGHDVTFVARGEHLDAMRRYGLRVNSVHGDFTVTPVKATDTPAEIDPVDWVLFCVKTPATEEAARAIRPIVKEDAVVTSLQNGIDAARRIGVIVGHQRMVGGATWISSAIEAPGIIRQVSPFRRVVFGELAGPRTERAERLAEVLRKTGVTAEVTDGIEAVLWTKFLFISAISAVGSMTRLAIGEYRHIPETRIFLRSLMREVAAVAAASGVALDPNAISQALALVDQTSPAIKPSMQRDVEAGRPSELESMIGVIVQRGASLGVPTPAAVAAYAALLPGERQARGTRNG